MIYLLQSPLHRAPLLNGLPYYDKVQCTIQEYIALYQILSYFPTYLWAAQDGAGIDAYVLLQENRKICLTPNIQFPQADTPIYRHNRTRASSEALAKLISTNKTLSTLLQPIPASAPV